jgi:hypothetical protein
MIHRISELWLMCASASPCSSPASWVSCQAELRRKVTRRGHDLIQVKRNPPPFLLSWSTSNFFFYLGPILLTRSTSWTCPVYFLFLKKTSSWSTYLASGFKLASQKVISTTRSRCSQTVCMLAWTRIQICCFNLVVLFFCRCRLCDGNVSVLTWPPGACMLLLPDWFPGDTM